MLDFDWPTQPIWDPDLLKAFASPEEFDWSGKPNKYEAAIMQAIEKGYAVIITPTILFDRKEMEKIVNEMRRESIEFTTIRCGLRLSVVQ
jgi:hypothetical protein